MLTSRVFIVFAILILSATAAYGDFRAQFSSNATYTDNLMSDSSGLADAYSTQSSSLKYYPFPSVEIAANADISFYRDLVGFGSHSGGGSVQFIPLPAESDFSLFFTSNFSARRYRQSFETFDNNSFSATGAVGYRINERIRARGGIVYRSVAYLANNSSDQESFEVFSGVNIALPGRNALDIETGMSFAGFETVSQGDYKVGPGHPFELPTEKGGGLNLNYTSSDLKSFHISPRFSRPIGSRTGVSATFTYREFFNTDDAIVLGAGVENLSPWQSVWQGRSISLNIKTYLVPSFIVSGGFGYFDKSFLMTLDILDQKRLRHAFYEQFINTMTIRNDIGRKFYLDIQRPVTLSHGLVIEPSLNLQYTNNTSQHLLYSYSGATITIGVSVRM